MGWKTVRGEEEGRSGVEWEGSWSVNKEERERERERKRKRKREIVGGVVKVTSRTQTCRGDKVNYYSSFFPSSLTFFCFLLVV